jgi:RNA polymerase sigma-70 factor (ECF subfamily)
VKDGALTRRQKEYIFLACSADNLSTYCVTAHCEIVRMLGIEGPEPEQIALDHTVSDIPASDKALLDLAVKMNNHPKDVGPEDIDELRRHGFSDQHILEMVIMVGLTKFSNFVAFGLGTVPDFDASKVVHRLGLTPPDKAEKKLNPSSESLPLIKDEDADLVSRTRSGDLDAFDQLVRRHQRRIYRTLVAITRNPEEAEDGLQNVFLSAFQHLGSFQGSSRFLTWLTRIAINEGAARLRTRKETETLSETSEGEVPFRPRDVTAWDANPEDLYSRTELRDKLEQALLKLPAKYRLPIMLRDLEQCTAEEAAEVLEITVAAFKSRLLRGRLMLREALAPIMGRRAANV